LLRVDDQEESAEGSRSSSRSSSTVPSAAPGFGPTGPRVTQRRSTTCRMSATATSRMWWAGISRRSSP